MELGSEDVADFMEEIFPLEIAYTVQKLGALFMTVFETSAALNLKRFIFDAQSTRVSIAFF